METPAQEEKLERIIGNLLRIGVLSAAVVVLAGGIWDIASGPQHMAFSTFQGEPGQLRHPLSIITGIAVGGGKSLVQLGLLLLIATPVARVVFSLIAFAHYRDRLYVIVTVIVLAALVFSLSGG